MNIYLFIAKISTLVEDCLLARAAQPVYSLCAAMRVLWAVRSPRALSRGAPTQGRVVVYKRKLRPYRLVGWFRGWTSGVLANAIRKNELGDQAQKNAILRRPKPKD